MPIHYEHDSEYENKNEEAQDKREATQAKLESLNKANIMDFDEFVAKEGIDHAIHVSANLTPSPNNPVHPLALWLLITQGANHGNLSQVPLARAIRGL